MKLKTFVPIIFFCLSLFLFPNVSLAEPINLPIVDGNKIMINSPVYIGPGQELNIPKGTEVYVSSAGYLYVKGSLFIGIESLDNSIQATTTPTVSIYSENKYPFIQSDGGVVIGINLRFSGKRFVEGYKNSDISISGSEFIDTNSTSQKPTGPFVSVFSNTSLDISYSNFTSTWTSDDQYKISSFIELFSQASSTISSSRFNSSASDSIFSVYSSSTLRVLDDVITSCDTWFTVFNYGYIGGRVNHSDCSPLVQAVFSQGISEVAFDFDICCSSVLFIPGLQGSRLYRGNIFSYKLWEPKDELGIRDLTMKTGGISNSGIYPTGILDSIKLFNIISIVNIYKSFSTDMKDLVSRGIIGEYKEVPYDWRYAPEQVVATHSIEETIKQMAKNSYSGKVSIVAHSYGGLITKELLKKLKDSHLDHLIDRVILIAVPETGTPSSLFAVLQGHNLQLLKGLFLSSSSMINLVEHMPSVYRLFPGTKFAKDILISFINKEGISTTKAIDKPVVISSIYNWFSQQVYSLKQKIASTIKINSDLDLISSPKMLKTGDSLLEESYRQVSSSWDSLQDSLRHTYHIWSLIGVGMPTLAHMNYTFSGCGVFGCKKAKIDTEPIYSTEGDGTVLLDSIDNRLGNRVLINLASLNKNNKTNIQHMDIMESKDVLSMINQILVSGYVAMSANYITDVELEKQDGSKIYQAIFKGDIIGGFKSQVGDSVLETKAVSTPQGISSIQEIPGSSIQIQNDGLRIQSIIPPSQIELISNKNQRIDVSYTVSTPIQPYTTSSNTSTTEEILFQNIIAPAGSALSLDITQKTLWVDIDNNKRLDISDHVYVASSEITSTSQISSNLLEDLDKIIGYLESGSTVYAEIQNISMKKQIKSETEYSKQKLIKLREILLKRDPNPIYLELSDVSYLNAVYDKSTAVERRLGEIEVGYVSLLNTMRQISIFPFNLLPQYRIQGRTNIAQSYKKDTSLLFNFVANANSQILEFTEKYANISN